MMTHKAIPPIVAACVILVLGQSAASGAGTRPDGTPNSGPLAPGPADEFIFGSSPFGSQQLILNGTTVVAASFTGWYNSSGSHNNLNHNYIAGFCCSSDHRDFFVFTVPNLGTITSATLSIGNP